MKTRMEQTQPYYDPVIINCDDLPDTISFTSAPQKHKKVKKPKTKRKRQIAFYNMDNLLITRKLKVKKTKYKCVINIKTPCQRSGSIVRSAYNVCKKEAYHQRIVPVCLRKMCSEGDISSCCRSTFSREYRNPKADSLSPVSSIAVTDVIACNNISYEDVSNGSFSIDSEESENELDTLIKRTKQRERQINHSYQSREYTSTPISKVDYIPTPSPYSIDTDKKSIHSDTTMVLHPLSSAAYSPTAAFDAVKIRHDDTSSMIDIDLPYSPTMTPDLIKLGMDYSPVRRTDDGNMPYSPTFTSESIEIDDFAINFANNDHAPNKFSSVFVKMENFDNTSINNNNGHGNEVYSPTITPDMIKKENQNSYVNIANVKDENDRYSPRCPTVTPDFHKFAVTRRMTSEDPNIEYSAISKTIKQENVNDEYTTSNEPNCAILTADLIKKEIIEDNDEPNSAVTDYNMNNTINCKMEVNDIQIRHSETYAKDIVVKKEREEHTNVNLVPSMVLQKNVMIKAEVKKEFL